MKGERVERLDTIKELQKSLDIANGQLEAKDQQIKTYQYLIKRQQDTNAEMLKGILDNGVLYSK